MSLLASPSVLIICTREPLQILSEGEVVRLKIVYSLLTIPRRLAVVLLWFSVACFWCLSFGHFSPYVCSYYFKFGQLLSGHLLGNSCSLG